MEANAIVLEGPGRLSLACIPLQDPTDHEAADACAAIPGARLLHLSHNKHELTFLWERAATGPADPAGSADATG